MCSGSLTSWTERLRRGSAIASTSTSRTRRSWSEFNSKPFHYETQFDIAAGHYNLKVVFNPQGADNFGKLEMPLVIDPYDGKQFTMSAVALSKRFTRFRRWDKVWTPRCSKIARRW